jgi:DivIVA domain-containing protein
MALVVGIILVAAVLLAVGLFAAGRLDGMSDAVPDVPPGLADGPVTPEGLRRVRLPVALRGYRMADVDELIERAAAELAAERGAEQSVGPRSAPPTAPPDAPPTEQRARPTPGRYPPPPQSPPAGPSLDKPRPYANPTQP